MKAQTAEILIGYYFTGSHEGRSIVTRTRRQITAKSGATALLGTSISSIADSAAPGLVGARSGHNRPCVKGLIRRDETTMRLEVWGIHSSMTWAADGRQFLSLLDGWGSAKPVNKVFHSRVLSVSGDLGTPKFEDVAGYPDMLLRVKEPDCAPFWGGGSLAVDGRLYQYLSTPNHPYLRPDATFWPDFYWDAGAKLIYSPDNGLTWHNQDGSSPVTWEKWDARSRANMVFFNEEPAGAFAWLNFLQMGRNYELNKDGYAYVYSPNGHVDGTMNELVMFRVQKSRILDRHSYEFFSGLRSDGNAAWTRDVSARAVVHTFPRGWVNRNVPGEAPWAWIPSVTYNAPLGVYMMTSWGTGCSPEGGWFAKPSYLGVWEAPTPWGPFTQIHEESAWTPVNDRAARALLPQIAPKWISADGKSLWLVWSDYQYKGTAGETENPDQAFVREHQQLLADDAEFAGVHSEWVKRHMPYTIFNMQRVDLIVE